MPLHICPDTVRHHDDYPLDTTQLQALWRMEERHFWHRARNRWILLGLRRRGLRPAALFLDVGCGGGAVTGALHGAGFDVTGVDTAETLVRKAHERCPQARLVVSDVAALKASEFGPFNGIGFFDVLEHLDHPAGLLKASLRLAAPDALVIATVPARRALRTVIDDLSGHKRRYEPGELRDLMRSCGLQRVEEQGIFHVTEPLQRMSRRRLTGVRIDALSARDRQRILVENFRVPPWPVNLAMDLLCRLEASVGIRTRSGASLLATGIAH